MKIKILIVSTLIHLFFLQITLAQENTKPKLVVGIVIDQMRYEYLSRFNEFYGNDGFKRLMNEGSNFTFAHYNYDFTSTGPGHASIYTGTVPFYHGIIANDFYDKQKKKMANCVEDNNYSTVGGGDKAGGKSPKYLLSTTISDQLKLFSNGGSKVISVSLKDRGAILPGGHLADGAYWYDEKTGDFITSSYYMSSLPQWVDDFNKRKLVEKYLSEDWNLLLPHKDYLINPPDNSEYEKDRFKENKTSFPHSFKNLKGDELYQEFQNTPFGDQILIDLTKSALQNEKLGLGGETDFLAISFSATDHIGHEFGTYSYEMMDTFIRLDKQIAELLNALDNQVGAGNYLLFLTADHGALETPAYLRNNRIPTGEINYKNTLDSLKSFSLRKFGDEELIASFSNKQIFFDRDIIKKLKLDIHEIERIFVDYLRDTFPQIQSIFSRDDLDKMCASREPANYLLNGFNPAKSGDVIFNLMPGYLINFQQKGTQHGSQYAYDTHVPIIFYGWHVPAKTNNEAVFIVDIAATVANLLKITEPSACIGIPLIR